MRKIYLLFSFCIISIGCEKDTIVAEKEIIDENSNLYYKTAKKENVLNFLNSGKHKQKSPFITGINTAQLDMQSLVNTDQLIAVVPATTVYENHTSRILMLEV